MPRKGAKGKWDLKRSPDEWYWKEDPHKVKKSVEEWNKCYFINGIITGNLILDIGCGEGHFSHTYGARIGIDISHIAVGRAKKIYGEDTQFFQHNITEDSFWYDYSDTIILSEVLYYIHL